MASNAKDTKKVNLVIDVIRHSRKDLFETALLRFASINRSAEDFDDIWWRGNGGVYSGNVNVGDIEAADWRNILDILNKSDIGIDLLPIKKYVTGRIESALRHGDWERQRRFLERD